MNRRTLLVAALMLLIPFGLVACNDDDDDMMETFTAQLSGDNEVPPVGTTATGMATITFDGTMFSYRIDLADITAVAAAHIHTGSPGENGPVTVTLFSGPVTGDVDGTLVDSTFTQGDLGQSASEIAELLRDEDTYVNVHTAANPGGEIRGPLQ